MYSRSCLIKAVIITLVVLSLLSIVGLLFWAYAANFVSLYLKAAKVDFGYVFMSDNLPDGTKSTTSLAMNAEASVGTKFPFDIGLLITVLEVRPVGPGSQPIIGYLRPRKELVMYHDDNGHFSLPAILEIKNYTVFHQFASKLLLSDETSLRLTTPASGGRVRLHLPFMPRNGWYLDFNIQNVKLDKAMVLTGCSGFPDSRLEVFTLDDGPSKFPGPGLNIHARVRFTSASSANVTDMGIINFDVFSGEDTSVRLGYLYTTGSLTLGPGENVIEATGKLIHSGEIANRVIRRYLSGRPSPMLVVSPKHNASSDPLFAHFVGGLSLSVDLNGVEASLISDAVFLMTVANILKAIVALGEKHPKPITLAVRARLKNPFGANIKFLTLGLAVTYNGVQMGRGYSEEPLTLAPYDQDWTPRVSLVVDFDPEIRRAAIQFLQQILEGHNTLLGLVGNFSFEAGGLVFNPQNYKQPPNIPGCLEVPPKNGANPQPCKNHSKI